MSNVDGTTQNREPMLAMIAACSENRVIGRHGRLPWHIPMDWQYFLNTTQGGVLIMGRKCYDEMVQMEALNDRSFIVLTRNLEFKARFEHTLVAHDLAEALALARQQQQTIWICGGQKIYEEALPLADRLYLTLVHTIVDGDTWFPDWRDRFTQTIQSHEAMDAGFALTFMVLAPRDIW